MSDLSRRLAVSRGDESADLVVHGGSVLCVFTREWLEADIAIVDGVIAGVGRYVVEGFARLVPPLGTTAVVVDPHEIASVLGSDGVRRLLDASEGLQLEVYLMSSSCVPASPFESPRRALTPGDLEALMHRARMLGLAEMMNFPGIVNGLSSKLEKLTLEGAGRVDGHAPGLHGKGLQAYAAAGIRSDQECLTAEDGRERPRDLLNTGVRVGLGVDGSASNEQGDLFLEVKQALLVARYRNGGEAMTTREAVRLATRGGAAVLHRDDIGSIELGGADDPVAGLVLAGPHCVDRLVVGGEDTVQGGVLVRTDEHEIAQAYRAQARRFSV